MAETLWHVSFRIGSPTYDDVEGLAAVGEDRAWMRSTELRAASRMPLSYARWMPYSRVACGSRRTQIRLTTWPS